jgi:nitrile hydratase subunit beta
VSAFTRGDPVRVRDDAPAGHVRTPAYVRGKRGWIERIHGQFRNPEQLAYGRDGQPPQTLYMVGFRQPDLWHERYRERRDDTLYVDLYEHWLESV